MKQRWTLLIAGIAILLGAGLWYWSQSREGAGNPAAPQLRAAPSFELPDAQGKKHRLEDLRGNIIVLHFWAAWCPPCLEEIPHWVELASEFKGRPLKLVAISLDPSWEEAHKILPSKNLDPAILSLLDPTAKVAEAYGSYQYPETYILDKNLKIVTKWVGPQNWKNPNMTGLIDKLLNL